MRNIAGSALVFTAFLCMAAVVAAQPPVGALAVDERQGDQYGWAVDYETAGAARAAALGECGADCSVVLTFERCAAYAADQDADSTAVGWSESYGSADTAQQAALTECRVRGGTGCIVRVWGCNGPVVEEGLGLDRGARRQIQRGLLQAGFDPGGADGLFGPRTRAAIRRWQTSRGTRATGYLDGASASALRPWAPGQPTSRQREPTAIDMAAATGVSAVQPPPTSAELEGLFWQSVATSTDPADFEAYLAQFPNGVFQALARNRLSALGASGGAATSSGVDRGGAPTSGSGPAGARVPSVDARGRPRARFRPVRTCAGQPAGEPCWTEVSQRPGCYVWSSYPQPTATATWTGDCAGGLAQGTGTLTWAWDAHQQFATGRLVDGKTNGHWVIRREDGTVSEGPFVDGKESGHWVWRYPDGDVQEAEGPYVNGKMNGNWVIRRPNGTVEEWLFRDGERVR